MNNKSSSLFNVEMFEISRFRNELMGVAMIFIIFFHINCYYPLSDLFKIGNIGVEIFLLLSGIGLWHSWTNNPDYKTFYKRRFLRIVPVWILFSSVFYLSHFFYPYFKGNNVENWFILIGQITINLNFWKQGDETFWFIPTIMSFYLFSPLYMDLIRSYSICRAIPILFIILVFFIGFITPLNEIFGHLELLIYRIPIFLIGINMGEYVKTKVVYKTYFFRVIIIFIVFLVISFWYKHSPSYILPEFFQYFIYIPLSCSTIIILTKVFRYVPYNLLAIFSWIGSLSLEFYLIHQNFLLIYFPIEWNFVFSFFLCFLLTAPVAWLSHYLIISIFHRRVDNKAQ